MNGGAQNLLSSTHSRLLDSAQQLRPLLSNPSDTRMILGQEGEVNESIDEDNDSAFKEEPFMDPYLQD